MLSLLICSLSACKVNKEQIPSRNPLSDGWQVQSSGKITAPDTVLSTEKFIPDGWYKATVPSTIMGVLIENGEYPDVLESENYKSVDRTRFDSSWWYRKEFALPALSADKHVLLNFDGITYRANIWLNGHLLASKDSIYGPFRQFTLDITPYAQAKNVLAVEVFRAQPGEPNVGFVDWNPRPADESMGIFREVYVSAVGDVAMAHIGVRSKVNTETLKEAWLNIETELTNLSSEKVDGELVGTMEGITFQVPVTLEAGETKNVKLSPDQVKELYLQNPRIWWCNGLGKPELYQLNLEFKVNGKVSAEDEVTFGVREIKDYFTDEGHRGFILNGKPVLIKGAGWTDDIFLRDTPETNEIQVQYVHDMNLNCIRFENVWGTSQNVYDLCDKYGLMVLVGWSCHWEWEEYLGTPVDRYGGIKSEQDMNLIAASLKDQVLWLRNHPSVIGWFVGSDMLPRPELEEKYMAFLPQIDDRPYIQSAAMLKSALTGASGMKMSGPYDYVGPNYWYLNTENGGAFGFNTETGIGAQLPVIESLRKMIPADKLWPVSNDAWSYHCTASKSAMNTLDLLTETIESKYGKAKDLGDYLKKADLLNYEGTRAMFEAFRVNHPKATGIVQWMLNSAWPSLYWQLYDYYRIPTAAYYGVKKGNMPRQLIYNYKDGVVYLVNEGSDSVNLNGEFRLYGLDSKLIKEGKAGLKAASGEVVKGFDIPAVKDNAFLFLQLTDEQGNKVADNWYCLSAIRDEYDWEKSNWVYTPLKVTADFKKLAALPEATCKVNATIKGDLLEATLDNPTGNIAFFTRLALKNEQGELITPVFWEDNYITLLPGEKLTLECNIPSAAANKGKMTLAVSGWNQKEQIIELR